MAVLLAALFAAAWLYVVLALAALNIVRTVRRVSLDGLTPARVIILVVNLLIIVVATTWLIAGA